MKNSYCICESLLGGGGDSSSSSNGVDLRDCSTGLVGSGKLKLLKSALGADFSGCSAYFVGY